MLAVQIFAAGIFMLVIITMITEFVMPAIWQPAIMIENMSRLALPGAYQASAMPGLTEGDLLGNISMLPLGFVILSFACIIKFMMEQRQEEEESGYHEYKDIPEFSHPVRPY